VRLEHAALVICKGAVEPNAAATTVVLASSMLRRLSTPPFTFDLFPLS
jgi:hypothetical protein